MTNRLLCTTALATTLLACVCGSAQASNWTWKFDGTETGTYTTNPLMLTSGEETLFGSTTSPRVAVVGATPVTELSADLRVDANLFNKSSFNSTDIFSNINASTKSSRWDAKLAQSTTYDTTRTSELSNYGRTIGSVRHFGLNIGPEIGFKPNERNRVSLMGAFAMSTYASSDFSDYNVYTLKPTYSHIFDPENTGSFSLQFRRYETTSGVQKVKDSVSPSVGWTTLLTPRWKADLNVGLQTSQEESEGHTTHSWNLNYVYSANVTFEGEQNFARFSASQAQQPLANGQETLFTTVSVNGEHRINPLLSLNASASYQHASYQSVSDNSLESLLNGGAGAVYHATDQIDISASYRYKYETLTNTSATAQDNTVMVGVNYHPEHLDLW